MAELHCPYCNAVVPLLPALRPGQQITCPRCEESFKAKVTADVPATATETPPAPVAPPVRQLARSNLQVALGVLGLMGVMASAGLALALLTKAERRANDSGLKRSRLSHKRRQQREADITLPDKVAPLELDALRWLPADSDVIVAAHVAEALREAGGRQRLEKTFPLLGSVGGHLERIEALTGLHLEDIDHIVAGARVNSSQGLPRIVVVVRTRSAYDARAVRAALKAREHPSARGRSLYMFQQELLPSHTQGLVSFPNKQTLVLGWAVNKLSDLPTRVRQGDEKLPGEITELLAGRGRPQGPVWIAGHSDNWPRALALLLALTRADQRQHDVLGKLRTFSAWLELAEGRTTLRAVVRCADGAGAEVVEKYLRDRLADSKGVQVTRKDEWLDIQYRPEK
jgi:hypothetical protein